MNANLSISFRGVDHSEAVEAKVRERADRLERLGRITNCTVVIQAPHQHSHKGNLYDVRIEIQVPGSEVLVNKEGAQNHAHEDVYVAVRDAFDAAERQLGDLHRKRSEHR
ncbi:MAG: HPF/RaiA family ribosome-associated protein [Myxococcales bacterium]|jgi:ribosomal subunit interface protein